MGRKIRTTLDLAHPTWSRYAEMKDRQAAQFNRKGRRFVAYEEGEQVWAKNLRGGEDKWLKGVIAQELGRVIRKVRTEDGAIVRRHKNQLRPRQAETGNLPNLDTTDAGLRRPAPDHNSPTLAERRTRRDVQAPRRYGFDDY